RSGPRARRLAGPAAVGAGLHAVRGPQGEGLAHAHAPARGARSRERPCDRGSAWPLREASRRGHRGALLMKRLQMTEPFRSPFYAPALVAVHGGHFAAAGFDVALTTTPPGGSTVDALLHGRADFAVSGIMRSLGLVDQGGPPIVHFATVNDRNGFFLVSRE